MCSQSAPALMSWPPQYFVMSPLTTSRVNSWSWKNPNPPLVALGLKADSSILAQVKDRGAFAVNVLATGQKDMAFAFFKPTQVEPGRLNGYAYEPGPAGEPLLTDAAAWFTCRMTDLVDRGDHHVVVAEVTEAGVRRETAALTLSEVGVFYGG